jgi:Tfp pilus assembly major pilin PilA
MNRMKHLGASLALGALAVTGLLASPASAATTTGTWYFHGPQTFTTTTTTTPGTPEYKSAVRPPINADNSSNFPAKRGVIPVQFDLLAAPTTTTTTTKTYDPPVWKSLQQDGSVTYAGINLNPTLTLNGVTNLSANYLFTTGDCYAGSLRWTIYLDSSVGSIHVYYGDPSNTAPSFQSCSGAYSETGKNLMSQVDLTLPANRFEIGNSGSYVDYAAVLAATNGGTDVVTGANLILESGWKADQRADVSNVTVNDNTWVPKTTETTTSTTVTGAYAKTCDLPAAELSWKKNDATPTGALNEAESIQPKDTGQYYRQVDCKYIYNLDVSSLNGQGTYTVWVRIGGMNIPVPATFDLR